MAVIPISIIIKGMGLVYYKNSKIDYILKRLGRMILLIANNIVDLIIVINKKVRNNIITTIIKIYFNNSLVKGKL